MIYKLLNLICLICTLTSITAQNQNEQFWNAARTNDVKTINELLDNGIDVNVKTNYGVTALTFAVDKNSLEAVNLLLEKGADPNLKDSFYGETPFGWSIYKKNIPIIKSLINHGVDLKVEDPILNAAYNGLTDIVKLMLEKGSPGAEKVALVAVNSNNIEMLNAAMENKKLDDKTLSEALLAATSSKNEQVIALLTKAGAKLPEKIEVKDKAEINPNLKGKFRNEDFTTIETDIQNSILSASYDGSPFYELSFKSDNLFAFKDFPEVTV